MFSLFLSLSLSRPGPACLFFPTCSSLQLALALLLCHTCSHLSHYFLSTSSICLPLFFVGLFRVYVSHACVLCYLHDHLPCLVLLKSSLEELHSSCVLSCLCHPAACDLVQGLCFSALREVPALLSILKTGVFLYRGIYLLCVCSSPVSLLDRLPVYCSIKAITELTFAPGSSVSSDRIIRPRWIQRRKVLSTRRSSCRGSCSVGMKRSCLSPDTLWRV